MGQAKRIDPATAHQKTESGEALLVCAYDDEQRCRGLHLKNSIHLNELQGKLAEIPKDKEIIFY